MPDALHRQVREIVHKVLTEQESRDVPYAVLRMHMVQKVIEQCVYKLTPDEAGRYVDTESVGHLLKAGSDLSQKIEEQAKLLKSLMVKQSG